SVSSGHERASSRRPTNSKTRFTRARRQKRAAPHMSVRATVKSIQDIMRQDAGVDGDAQRISQLCWMFFLKILDDQDEQLELMQDSYHSPIPAKLRWGTWAADPEGMTGDELLAFINNELFPGLKNLSLSVAEGQRQRVV